MWLTYEAFLYISSLDIDVCFIRHLVTTSRYIDTDISFYGHGRLEKRFYK
jgi:hypothetical protein